MASGFVSPDNEWKVSKSFVDEVHFPLSGADLLFCVQGER
jgi:hypothetical protein